MSQEAYDTTEKKDKAEDHKVKLAKLGNVVYRKASIIKEILNKVDALKACESTCHECTLEDEVWNYKEDFVVEKEELIKKKDMENKEIMRKNMKIRSPQYESVL